jgi:hypothetical protein
VAYLGHMISKQDVAMDRQKVEAILECLVPRSMRALRAFLGLVGYYRRFIRDYGTITSPLTSLLRKDAFWWSPEAEVAFRALQHALKEASVL